MTLLAGALLLVLAATPASADHATTYQADLQPLNDSGVTATADLSLADRELEITINAEGLAPGQPHAQHIHGVTGETSACPGPDADQDGDGLVSTAEGVPSYGGVLQSLTTEGDTSGDSALAVDRFPVAGDDGSVSYSRTFELPQDVADDLGNLHLVLHGIDLDDSGAYDGDAVSSLDDSLPLEATIPAACGTLAAMPSGGVQTGAGGTAPADGGATPMVALFGLGLLGTGALVARRRREARIER
ncbi:MAG: hypothetical protein KY460_06525 [Actinobacteria bacterium]|nr:hypothetical protein [Actinomycetota bacterium]